MGLSLALIFFKKKCLETIFKGPIIDGLTITYTVLFEMQTNSLAGKNGCVVSSFIISVEFRSKRALFVEDKMESGLSLIAKGLPSTSTEVLDSNDRMAVF